MNNKTDFLPIHINMPEKVYKYMLSHGIDNPQHLKMSDLKKVFLNVVSDYRAGRIDLYEFVELLSPLWFAPQDDDDEDVSKLKSLLDSVEQIQLSLPKDLDYYTENKEVAMKEFFDYLEASKWNL